jgi:uncharacterized protein with PIN domain
MVELKTYRCDRCQKQFSKPLGEKPSSIVRHDENYIPDEDEEGKTFELCDDCIMQFWNWEIHDEDFDKFATSMTEKWEKEAKED